MTTLQPNYGLQVRQEKIQVKRSQTSWRDFIQTVTSWFSVMLYKNHGLISKFPDTDRIKKLRLAKDFEQERDNLISHGIGYDCNTNFFDAYAFLFQTIGLGSMIDFGGNENTSFAECTQSSKNVYLSFVTILGCENVFYSFSIKDNSHNIFNSIMVGSSSNIYYSTGIQLSHNIYYSRYIYSSSNIWLSANLQNCNECIRCQGLEHKSYCIDNQQLSKDEYEQQKKILLRTPKLLEDGYNSLLGIPGASIASSNITGEFLSNCHDVSQGYMSTNLKNASNVLFALSEEDNENYRDIFCAGRSQHMYGGVVTGTFSSHIYNSMMISNSTNIFYSYGLNDCSFCLGCIGLKNKSYCILNKQYTKEERYEKVDEIFTQMEKDGQLGEFFPATMNPFYFNDTAAYLIDPSFTKEEVTKLGYLWRDEPIKVDIPEGAITVKSSELGQFEGWEQTHPTLPGQGGETKWKLDETVCKRVIIDDNGDAYRIIPMELEFLQKHGLPLPRKHRLTRMKENFRIR